MNRRTSLLFVVALLFVPFSWASADVLTWQDCLSIAKSKNPDLISAEKAMQAGQYQYRGSFNGIFPHLSLTHGYSDSSVPDTETSAWQANANASLDLLDAAQFAGIKTASANLKLSEANVRIAAANLLFNLRTAFAQLLYAQEAISVAEHVRDIWNQSAQMTSLRYDSGSESKGNLMRIKAQLFQAVLNLSQTQRDVRVAQQTLGQALGIDDFEELVATGTLSTNSLPDRPANMKDLAEVTPTVEAQKATLAQALAALSVSRSNLWPALSFDYTRSYTGPHEFPSNSGWSFLGLLNLPIFSNGPTATYYAIAAGKRNVEKASEDLRSTRHQTMTDLETGWSSLAQNLDEVKIQTAFLEADTQRKAEADIRYENGLLTFDNWEIIVTDLVDFEQSHLKSELNAVNAEATWDKANGKGLEPSL